MAKYAQQKTRIAIPRGFSKSQRDEIGLAILDFIVQRDIGHNTNKKGRSYAKYTDAYAKEKGVSKSDVTLDATGSMHDNMEVLKTYSNYITIGYDTDYSGMGKVEGNRKGTYGQKTAVTKPRDFLGITKKDLNSIIKQFKRDEKRALREESVANEASQLNEAQLKALEN